MCSRLTARSQTLSVGAHLQQGVYRGVFVAVVGGEDGLDDFVLHVGEHLLHLFHVLLGRASGHLLLWQLLLWQLLLWWVYWKYGKQ